MDVRPTRSIERDPEPTVEWSAQMLRKLWKFGKDLNLLIDTPKLQAGADRIALQVSERCDVEVTAPDVIFQLRMLSLRRVFTSSSYMLE